MQDNPGSDEAKRRRGDPFVRGCPGPGDSVGVRGERPVQRERHHGDEPQRQDPAPPSRQPRRRPAVEQHRHDQYRADHATADRPDRGRLEPGQVAQPQVRRRASADHGGVPGTDAPPEPADAAHRPAAQRDIQHRLPHPHRDQRAAEVRRGHRTARIAQPGRRTLSRRHSINIHQEEISAHRDRPRKPERRQP